ncbi:MAG: porin family protein [Legionellales bacterium]|nr:porin family protein [Legionellales bacterium]
MMLTRFSLAFGAFCSAMCACAGDMGHPSPAYFISISAAPSWTHVGSTQTIALQPDVIKAYVPRGPDHQTLGNGEIFLGVQKSFFQQVTSQFGLAIYASSPATLGGFIQEDASPNFQNYTYQYQISHGHIGLKTKWIAENSFNINPYLGASIGVGFNRSYGYTITPLIFQEVPAPPFQSTTKVVFSYGINAGFQHTLNQHFTCAIGYQLVSWGSSNLAQAAGQTSSRGLGLNNLYTQGVEFNVSYYL